jgi:hypothetical protein
MASRDDDERERGQQSRWDERDRTQGRWGQDAGRQEPYRPGSRGTAWESARGYGDLGSQQSGGYGGYGKAILNALPPFRREIS